MSADCLTDDTRSIDKTYFKYRQLPSNHVRLLHILPRTDQNVQSIIELRLEIVDLRTAPQFNALSYTWGPPTSAIDEERLIFSQEPRCYPFVCNGKLVRGTRNLRDALVHIRLERQEHAAKNLLGEYGVDMGLPLWVDALCINQDDIQERNEQVGIMSTIYKKAQHTIAWLGDHDEYSHNGVRICRELARLWVTNPIPLGEDILPGSALHLQLLGTLNSAFKSSEWTDFDKFMHRHWFSRTWVLQEIAMSQAMVLMCGSLNFDWDCLWRAANYVALSKFDPTTGVDAVARANEQETLQSYVSDRRSKARGLSRYSRIHFINALKKEQYANMYFAHGLVLSSDCLDPRDKVYALLGAIKGLERIKPNYLVNTTELYTKAWFYAIQDSANLKLLFTYQNPDRISKLAGLPSWCPDLTQAVDEESFHVSGDRYLWYASKGLAKTWTEVDLVDGALRLQGIQVSTILESMKLSNNNYVNADQPLSHASLVYMASRLDRPSSRYSSATESKFEILWRTLMAGSITTGAVGDSDIELAVRAFYQGNGIPQSYEAMNMTTPLNINVLQLDSLDRALRELKLTEFQPLSRLPELTHLREYLRTTSGVTLKGNTYKVPSAGTMGLALSLSVDYNNAIQMLQDACAYKVRIHRVSQGRSLVRTNDNCLGLASQGNRPGDEVWLLNGLDCPCVLRHMPNGRYKFLGCAYIHGIMCGEAVPTNPVSATIEIE